MGNVPWDIAPPTAKPPNVPRDIDPERPRWNECKFQAAAGAGGGLNGDQCLRIVHDGNDVAHVLCFFYITM